MNKKILSILLLLIIGFIPLLDLFHGGLPQTHDGIDHVARIANFYENLKEGNLIPRWAGNLNWGYGHPILMFLYPLSSYVASLFHFVGFGLVDSVKIVFGLGVVLSGIFMYLWVTEMFGPLAGLVSGVLYMVTPYKFIELYVRGDIGENLAFAFVPLVLYFLLKSATSQKQNYRIGLSFSVALLILAHNAISLMFMPLFLFYLWYLVRNKKNLLIPILFYFFLGFVISAFFWVPGLLEGKYTLRNVVTKNGYLGRFVNIPSLFYGIWNYGGTGQFSVQLGIMNWLALFCSIFSLFLYKKSKEKLLVLLLLIFCCISLFLMLDWSGIIWSKFLILQNFQFPWRFLAIPVFVTAALSGYLVSVIPQKKQLFFAIPFLILVLFLNRDYWHANGYTFKPESYFTSVYYGTTDTGESAPIWSVRFMEHPYKYPVEVNSGKADFRVGKRTMTEHSYDVTVQNYARLRENTVYFPGWVALVDGKETPIQYQDPSNRGVITFDVSNGHHSVVVKFTETKFRFIADMVSLAGLLFILLTALKFVI